MISKQGIIPLILAPILGPAVFLFLFVFIILNEVVRLLVSIVLLLKHGNKVSLVSDGADGYWAYKKTGSTRNVLLYILTPEGSLSLEKIADFYQKEIQFHRDTKGQRGFKKFEKILVTDCGYFCWKSVKNFSVYNHIRVLNEKKVYSVEGLEQLLSALAEDMPESKPQWELVIIPKYDDGSGDIKSILMARFVHGYMDGLSFLMLFKEHLTPDLEYTIDPLNYKIPPWKKVLFYTSTLLYGPFYSFLFLIEKFVVKPWILIPNPNSDKNNRKKYFAWAKSLPISDESIRQIRMQSGKGTTVTNVLCAAFVSAVTKILPPHRLVRELLISELVAYLPYPNSNPQNRFAYFTYAISTEDQENKESFDKLQKCKEERQKSILGPDVLSTFYFLKLAGRLPAFLSAITLQKSNCSVLLSNAPFSKNKCTLRDGTPILGMAGFTPQPNDMGLSITTTRYGEDVKVFACADSTWLTQAELSEIIDQIPKEINKMAQLCPPLDNLLNNNITKNKLQ